MRQDGQPAESRWGGAALTLASLRGGVLSASGIPPQPSGVVAPEEVVRSIVRVSGGDGPVVPSTAIATGASEKTSSSPNRPASDDPSVIRRLRWGPSSPFPNNRAVPAPARS